MSHHSHLNSEDPKNHCAIPKDTHSCCDKTPPQNVHAHNHHHQEHEVAHKHCCSTNAVEKVPFFSQKVYFYICLILTMPFFISMLAGHEKSHELDYWFNLYLQLILATPVFIIGMLFFGLSAWRSIVSGSMNMNVLIVFGSAVSYFFSLYHVFSPGHHVIYFETSSSIITLVLFGNFIEEWTVRKTHAEVQKLIKTQDVKANMLVYNPDGSEHIFQMDAKDLKVGDLILIKSGEAVPADSKILWGTGAFDESIISGESLPITRTTSDFIIGASMLTDGNIKAQVTKVGKDTVLNNIIHLITTAQAVKPKIQKLADKISAIFVPSVLGIALLCFVINYFLVHVLLSEAVLRAITVLIIACPCAMGLATPAAIAVGLSRGTKLGILYKDANCLEQMKKIQQIVFDKTGTLTTGNFEIDAFFFDPLYADKINQDFVYSILKHSNHPIALSVTRAWKTNSVLLFDHVSELKGLGMRATKNNDIFEIGSKKICDNPDLKIVEPHSLYIFFNKKWVGWINLKDTIRPEAYQVIKKLKSQGIEPIILSGDKHSIVKDVAENLKISTFYAEKSPEEKLKIITNLKQHKFTLMIGDGINDAPALAQADIGASIANAASITLNTAQIILTNNGISELPRAIKLGKETYNTIRSNLFWAFFYNIITIPIAAAGLLGQFAPTFGAIIMAGSDVVLFLNSAYLFKKNLD
ncbi:MAG: cation-translocating P-type ATPase [Alphaproteobacteria bacterium]|nr:cation-translocating P-type ATPase [Alphaproteobacteria bacterium]